MRDRVVHVSVSKRRVDKSGKGRTALSSAIIIRDLCRYRYPSLSGDRFAIASLIVLVFASTGPAALPVAGLDVRLRTRAGTAGRRLTLK